MTAQPYNQLMPDFYGDFNRAYADGKKRQQQNNLEQLAGEYFGGQATPDRAQNLLGQIASNGGDAAGYQKHAQGMDDQRKKELGEAAYMVDSAPEHMKAQLYSQIVQKFAARGVPMPPDYTPDLAPMLKQAAAVYTGGKDNGPPAQQQYLQFLASQVPESERQDVYRNAAGTNPRDTSRLYEGRGGAFSVNLGDNTATPIIASGVPQVPSDGPPRAPGDLSAVLNLSAQHRFQPTSFGRSPQENASTPGAAKNSNHLTEDALDYSVNGKSQQQVQAFVADMENAGWVGKIHMKGTGPHLHFDRASSGGGQQVQAPKDKPSAFQERIEFARANDATPAQLKRMALGGEDGGGLDVKSEMALRKEYSDLIKEPLSVHNSFVKIQQAMDKPSAAGDLSAIFMFMKMLDPTSVVRETEFANAQNAAGVPDRVQTLWNKALRGERLSPGQRADFMAQAEGFSAQAQTTIDNYKDYYRGLATEYEFDPDRIAVDPNKKRRSGDGGGSAPSKLDDAQRQALLDKWP